MITTLRICRPVLDDLKRYHIAKAARVERLSFIFGRALRSAGRTLIVVPTQEPILFADDCFVHQSGGSVTLDSGVLNGVLLEIARSDWNVIINVHDHWFSKSGTRFSGVDDADDLRFAGYLSGRFEPMLERNPGLGPARNITLASLVLDHESIDARTVRTGGRRFEAIDEIQVIGEHMHLVQPNGAVTPQRTNADADGFHARHADFIVPGVRDAIARLRFALIGCGGLGSIIGEGLLRLGARHFTLIDGDRLERANLNRWQGAMPGDVGRQKAELLASRLAGYAPDGDYQAICAPVESDRAREALSASDIVVGALDCDIARFMLNRIAALYLMPYFDAGVVVDLRDGIDFWGRYSLIVPGTTGCMECTRSYLIDGEAVATTLSEPLGRAAREQAGYVDGGAQVSAPSVYALNLQISATLLTEILNYLAAYRPAAMLIQQRWRGQTRRLEGVSAQDCPASDCVNCSYYHGRGDTESLPLPGRHDDAKPGWIEDAARFAAAATTEESPSISQPSTGAHHGQT